MCYNVEEIRERGWKMEQKRCIMIARLTRGQTRMALLFAVAALTGLLLWFFLAGSSSILAPGKALLIASERLTDYRVDFRLIPEERALAISQSIQYQNNTRETLNRLILRTWLNAFESEETSPAALEELYDACYPSGFSPGGLALYDVTWNGEAAEYTYVNADKTALQINIPELKPGESGTLFLRCVAAVPSCAYRTGYTDGCWRLGNVVPLLSVYENGEWRTDAYFPIGDPFISDCANFHVSLDVPEGFLPACSAALTKGKDGLWRGDLPAARDLALCIYDHAAVAKAKAGSILILSYADTQEQAKRGLDDAKKALQTFSALYGEYPYPTFSVCQADFPFSGMEYPALCMIGREQYTAEKADSLELTIAHETAHQWFYALVGSDQALCPWQDEAMCEYAVLRYVRQRYGQSSFEALKYYRVDAPMMESVPGSLTPGSPISYYSSYQDYRAVVYGRGAALLLALDEFLPKGTDDFLKAYVKSFAFQYVTRAQLDAFLNRYSGQDTGPLLLDYLDTIM